MLVKIKWKTSEDKTLIVAKVGPHEVCRLSLQEIQGQLYWNTKLLLPRLKYSNWSNPYHKYKDLSKVKKWATEEIMKWFEEALGG